MRMNDDLTTTPTTTTTTPTTTRKKNRGSKFRYQTYLFPLLLAFSVLGAVLCLIPFAMGLKYNDGDMARLKGSINSEYHLDSLLFSITACLVISFDGVLDYLFGSTDTMKTTFLRWFLLLSLIIPNSIMFIIFKTPINLHNLSPELFSTMSHIREIFFQTSLITFLTSSSSAASSTSSTTGPSTKLFFYSLITQITLILGITIFHYGNFMSTPIFLLYIAYISIVISAGLILWMLFSRFKYLTSENFTSSSSSSLSIPPSPTMSCPPADKSQEKSGDFENLIYISCLTFNIFGRYFIYFITLVTVDMSHGYQSSLYNCVDVVTVLIIITVHGRKSREESILFQNQLARKRTFVKYISHEIRTPLNIISLGVKYLVDNLENFTLQSQMNELKESLLDIQESSDVAICTLNNILAFETLDTGELTLLLKETSPALFIRSTVKMFKIQAAHAGVNLRYEGDEYLSPSLKTIASMIDTNKMSQVIRNLISNALKFTKSGGSVTVRAYHKIIETNNSQQGIQRRRRSITDFYSPSIAPSDRDYLVIEIEDTGIGMTEENCNKLFTRVIQFDTIDVQNGNGTGLGLMITKSIVEAHGGKIFVRSTPQQGSIFTVMLKCYEKSGDNNDLHLSDPPDHESEKKKIIINTNENNGNNNNNSIMTRRVVPDQVDTQSPTSDKVFLQLDRCLIVDDSSLNRKLLEKHLKNHFKILITAENGLLAVEEVKKIMKENEMFDLICLDSVMPEMGGPEAITHIRHLGYKGLVVGVTGNALPEQILDFKAAGVDEVLPKPVDIDILFSVVRHHRRLSLV